MKVIDEFTILHPDGTTLNVSVIEDSLGKRYIVEDLSGVHAPVVYSPGGKGSSDPLTPGQQLTVKAIQDEVKKRNA